LADRPVKSSWVSNDHDGFAFQRESCTEAQPMR
jgi:hypothetical protein